MLKVIIFLSTFETKVYKDVTESLLNTVSLVWENETKQGAFWPHVVEHLRMSTLHTEILLFFSLKGHSILI